MRLRSNFRDFYDHAFDGPLRASPVFERMSTTERTRSRYFIDLGAAGFEVAPWSVCSAAPDAWGPTALVVVYQDERAHRGEGKALMDADRAAAEHPRALCSRFIRTGERPTSIRLLFVGGFVLWLRYSSDDEWRSNVGHGVRIEPAALHVNLRAIAEPAGERLARRLRAPLLAVDLVALEAPETPAGARLLALDLNTAPGIGGTGLEGWLNPGDIVRLIEARARALETSAPGA